MKYSYYFEGGEVLFYDHELDVRKIYPLMRKHGLLVGYTVDDKVFLMEDITCGYHL